MDADQVLNNRACKQTKSIVAVDLSLGNLKKAQKKAEKVGANNIRSLQSDGKTIQLEDNQVDLILLITVFHEVSDSETVLKSLAGS